MTFVQAGFCCDAYQEESTTVVVVVVRGSLVSLAHFRDNCHHPMSFLLSAIDLD